MLFILGKAGDLGNITTVMMTPNPPQRGKDINLDVKVTLGKTKMLGSVRQLRATSTVSCILVSAPREIT